jgi:NADPH:quinone reductase
LKQVVATDQRLELSETKDPLPGPGQLLIDVAAAGVGLVDVLMSQAFGPNPFVPGIEVAGTVAKVSTGVAPALIGTRVFARVSQGGYAQRVIAEASETIELPDALDEVNAVGLGVNALVAHFALNRAVVAAGQRVLVRGASGGIGVMAIQLAEALGATVIASSRGRHGERLCALGAREVVGPNASGAEDFDVVIDPVAGSDVGRLIARLRPNGRYVIAGIAGGMPPDDFGKALAAGFRRTLGVSTFSLDTVSANLVREAAGQLFARAARKQISAVVDRVLPLAEAARAHALLSGGEVLGKLVLRP